MTQRRLKHFGWGREGEAMTSEEENSALETYRALFATSEFTSVPVPTLEAVALREPRISPPSALVGICSTGATTGPPMHSESRIRILFSGCLTIMAARPMSSPIPGRADVMRPMDWAAELGAMLDSVRGRQLSGGRRDRSRAHANGLW